MSGKPTKRVVAAAAKKGTLAKKSRSVSPTRKPTTAKDGDDDAVLKEAADLFLSGLGGGADNGGGESAKVEANTSHRKRHRVETPTAVSSSAAVAASVKVSTKKKKATVVKARSAKARAASKATEGPSASGKFFVALEEGGDAEDEAVSRQVLARTAAFLSHLSAPKQKAFWSSRSVASGGGERARDGTSEKSKKATIAAAADAAKRNGVAVKDHAKKQNKRMKAARWVQRYDGASFTEEEEADESESHINAQENHEDEETEDALSSASSSEPSWISESDDEEYFAKLARRDRGDADHLPHQPHPNLHRSSSHPEKHDRRGETASRTFAASNAFDSGDSSEDEDDEGSDGVWSDDD